MRATFAAGIVIAVLALSACARTVPSPVGPDRQASAATPSQRYNVRPQKTPGQTRLSSSRQRAEAAPEVPDRDKPRPPMATYSQYDGRGPGAARVPRDVAEAEGRTPTRPATGKTDDPVPGRDIVDLLGSKGGSSKKPATPPAKTAALNRAPAPPPRPILQSPRPAPRPTVSGVANAVQTPAPALPPQPRIASQSAPSLSAPKATLDKTPTGLPRMQPGSGSALGIPLGTVPASLGTANIRAAEAVQPAGDGLEQSNADESGAIGWDEAASLIRAGEVEGYADIGEYELLLTLCSGRGVIAIQPTPGAIFAVEPPKVVCGKETAMIVQ